MANTKRYLIEGHIPYDAGWGTPEHDTLRECLATLNLPCYGVRISYTKQAIRYEPVENGGQRAYYGFKVSGTEATRIGFHWRLLAALHGVGAEVYYAEIKDLDAPEVLIRMGNKGEAWITGAEPCAILAMQLALIHMEEFPQEAGV